MWYRLIFFCEENQKLSSDGFTFYGLSTASTTLIPFLFATFITKITSSIGTFSSALKIKEGVFKDEKVEIIWSSKFFFDVILESM